MKKDKSEGKVKIGLISEIDLKSPGIKVLYWSLFLILVILALIAFLPPLWVMVSSTKDTAEFYAVPPTVIPKSFNLAKLISIWNDISFGKYYMNTIYVTLGTIVASITFNGLAGYVLAKLKPRGSTVVFALLMATMMIPNNVSMVPVYKNIINFPLLRPFASLGVDTSLINTFWPMWMMSASNIFLIIVFKGFFDGIPTSYIEAAHLDGCNAVSVFTRVVLPLSKPVIATASILTVTSAWSDFFWPYMVLKTRDLSTVIVIVYKLRDSMSVDRFIPVLTFAMLPPMILFMFFQKNIMQGFSMSGLKG